MLELINKIEQQIQQDDLTIELLGVGKSLLQRQESIMQEQQFVFFGLCCLVFIVLTFQIFTIRYWRK